MTAAQVPWAPGVSWEPWAALLAVVLQSAAPGGGETRASGRDAADEPTYAEHVAPILREHCAPCHRPGESGPFPLLDYGDARKRADQIAEVTGSGFMPPWLPRPSAYRFANDRSLERGERETLERWARAGAPAGDLDALPPLDAWPTGWRLGTPDLVLELERPFELAADGSDEFRNLVYRNPLDSTRRVRALELRPESSAAHHAIVQVDETPSCEVLDSIDDAPGFPGMGMGESQPPDGHFIGWTPGKQPRATPPDMAWRLRPGADVVVQLHLTRTGKTESIRPRVGLYFTDRPPTRFPYSIVLYREDIDIPAGAREHAIRDEYRVPTDVRAYSVYPHAHYLGRSLRAIVARPDGSREELLRIDDWDFDWQDEYHFVEPVDLPAGALLTMEWVFDNSSDNVRNPHAPPRRVTFGESSADEMATMTLQVLPLAPEGRAALEHTRWTRVLERRPYDWHAHNALAALAIEAGDYEAAARSIDDALAYNPEFPDALANAGLLLLVRGDAAQALELFARALELEPAHAGANAKLGVALRALGREDEARDHYGAALRRWPLLAEARVEYANLLALSGELEGAVEQYHAALRVLPGLAEAHNNLANTYLALERYDRAVQEYERAVELRPEYFNAHYNLGRCLLTLGQAERAVASLLAATRLRPDDAAAERALRAALIVAAGAQDRGDGESPR